MSGLSRRGVWALIVAGLAVALVLAFAVSPFASSSPDGLEKVAADEGIAQHAQEHHLADGPLADYGVSGVSDERLSTGLAGIIGVLVTFGVGFGVFFLLRGRRLERSGTDAPVATPS
jgi:cobalt/nickel transport system permease protein